MAGRRRAPRDDLDTWLSPFVEQKQSGPFGAGTQFDANGSRCITHAEYRFAIRLNVELGPDLPGSVNKLETATSKNRCVALGKGPSLLSQEKNQEHEIDDRDSDGQSRNVGHDFTFNLACCQLTPLGFRSPGLSRRTESFTPRLAFRAI